MKKFFLSILAATFLFMAGCTGQEVAESPKQTDDSIRKSDLILKFTGNIQTFLDEVEKENPDNNVMQGIYDKNLPIIDELETIMSKEDFLPFLQANNRILSISSGFMLNDNTVINREFKQLNEALTEMLGK